MNLAYSYPIEISVAKLAIEKINKSTVIVRKVLKSTKRMTTIELHQLLLESCVAIDTWKSITFQYIGELHT